MLLKLPYNGILNDLFSAGVILFNLVTGRSPFNSADPKTGMYKYIATNQHKVRIIVKIEILGLILKEN
jgi:serine/threonine protein kinase